MEILFFPNKVSLKVINLTFRLKNSNKNTIIINNPLYFRTRWPVRLRTFGFIDTIITNIIKNNYMISVIVLYDSAKT